jgi:aflatoxin B1 aldehyde reductase
VLVPACRRYGLDIVVYNPLCAGLSLGKITSNGLVPAKGGFTGPGNMGVRCRDRYFRNSILEALQIIEQATDKSGLSMRGVALRSITHHSALKGYRKGGNDGIIIGVSNHDQVVSNLDNLEKGPLPIVLVMTLD